MRRSVPLSREMKEVVSDCGRCGVQWWQVDKVNPIKLFDDNKSVGGFQLRRLMFRQGQHAYVRAVVDKIMDMYRHGKIRPVIDSIWAFEDVSA